MAAVTVKWFSDEGSFGASDSSRGDGSRRGPLLPSQRHSRLRARGGFAPLGSRDKASGADGRAGLDLDRLCFAQEEESGAPPARSLRDERDHRAADRGVIATDGREARSRWREEYRAGSEGITPGVAAREEFTEGHVCSAPGLPRDRGGLVARGEAPRRDHTLDRGVGGLGLTREGTRSRREARGR